MEIDGVTYDVDVDILAGMYGGTRKEKRSQHVQGIKALKATGGDFAFRFAPQNIKIEAKRPDGAVEVAKVNVVAVVPYLVMKTAAMGRGKAKDAYDIYFLIKHYAGGASEIGKLFEGYIGTQTIVKMKEKLSDKFRSPEHAGPVDIANFLDSEDEDEKELIKRDAYEQIQAFLKSL